MNKDKKDGSIEELIRDATMSTPMSKSEMRDRLNKLIKQLAKQAVEAYKKELLKKLPDVLPPGNYNAKDYNANEDGFRLCLEEITKLINAKE